MSLKNDTFPMKRHWLASAFSVLPEMPDAFSASRLSDGRKRFLAGGNQLTAIRNWLACGEVIDASGRKGVSLTDLGNVMSAQDRQAKSAVTWWLLHLHLSANKDSFPYSAFFTTFDVDGNWITVEDVVRRLVTAGKEQELSESTVETYFTGVDSAFRPGEGLYGLGLIERRDVAVDGSKRRLVRRTSILTADVMVVYATLLFQRNFFPKRTTVETRDLLAAGLARALGMKDNDLRDSLSRVHQHKDFARFLQYRRQVNLDSVQFSRQGDEALKSVRVFAYGSGQVKWN